jgi:hypothetical protein
MPTIAITSPGNNDTVAPNFTVSGTVSAGIATVTVTLTSSKAGVQPVNSVVDSSTGTWTCNFTVDPNDFPDNSTVTATITGQPISNSITVKIGTVGGGG